MEIHRLSGHNRGMMASQIYTFTVSSKERCSVLDINHQVNQLIEKSGTKEGICHIFVPHATAAVIINENADPNIGTDLLGALEKTVPFRADYLHDKVDGNAAAHIKAAIIGPSETIPIIEGKPALGDWQDIMLTDFDGPKKRTVIVTIIS